MKTKTSHAKTIAFIGMLGALSAVLMSINIPLPFAPTFLKFDIAELPALFAGFFLGPVSGCAVIVVKIILKLLLQGTETAFVGELMNIVGSCAFVLPAALIYKRVHTKRGAMISLSVSTVLVSIMAIFLNAYIAFPMYSSLYGMPMEAILEMGSSVNPLVHDNVTLMLYGVFPFNLVKHGITSLVTYLVYKRCGNALRALLSVRAAVPAAQ
nr:ECF transporter S component [uncultured Oscillibacter sp.]